MQKQSNSFINALRWLALVPAVLLTWYVFLRITGPIPHLMITWGLETVWAYLETPLTFIIPALICVLTYFVGKWIAPNHKKAAGWFAIAVPILYFIILWLYTILR